MGVGIGVGPVEVAVVCIVKGGTLEKGSGEF